MFKKLTVKLTSLFSNKKVVDEALLKDLETQLILADVGADETKIIIDRLRDYITKHELATWDEILPIIKEQLLELLNPLSQPLIINDKIKPYVIVIVGVNGSGKTTTIGKLAKELQKRGKKIMLAAADTFRAAAIEQLKIWGERNGVSVIAHHANADSAAVAYDALKAAEARGIDVLLIDTAGRLHTQSNLMDELKKIKRVLSKNDPSVPHEVLLVLDATIGQNALNQAREFNEAVGVTGLIMTKLDGTAKGGIVFAIAKELQLPFRFVGTGEGIDDLKPFHADEFIDALFK